MMMITPVVANVLLDRAEMCFIGRLGVLPPVPYLQIITDTLGKPATPYIVDADKAMWQSLLAREVLMQAAVFGGNVEQANA